MPSAASIIGIGLPHASPYSNNAYNLECYTTCINQCYYGVTIDSKILASLILVTNLILMLVW
jgi:uncharacterized membrane protein